MRAEAQAEYLANLTEVLQLSKPQFVAGTSPQERLAIIRRNAQRQFELRKANDRILSEALTPAGDGGFTEAQVQQLEAFAEALLHFSASLDAGAAHMIHRALCAHAERWGLRDMLIRELYFSGLSLNYLNLRDRGVDVNMFGNQVAAYFERGAAWMRSYEQIADEQTRGYIVRCLGNRKMGKEEIHGWNSPEKHFDMLAGYPLYLKIFDEAMAVIRSPHYRGLNPSLPWDSFEYAMHFDRVIYLDGLRDRDDPQVARDVLESARFVYNHQEQIARIKDRMVGPRTRYVYLAARYHAGEISVEELVDSLLRIHEAGNPDDFSASGLIYNLRMPLLAFWYSRHRMDEGARLPFEERIQRALEDALHFLQRVPRNEYAGTLNKYVAQLVHEQIGFSSGALQRLLNYTLACHPPTYVHSRMVAWLSRRLAERMVDVAPEKLAGTLDCPDAQAVRENREKLCARVYACGLYHDVGKSMVLQYIGVYWRSLMPEEYQCIQRHAQLGYSLLKDSGNEEFAEVALRHHCFYDGSGGYPSQLPPCPKNVRAVVDLVTVADVLDAATDDVGRCYSVAKTLAQVTQELRQGSGTRYSPDVVCLLEDPAFFAEMETQIREQRARIYCDNDQKDEDIAEAENR